MERNHHLKRKEKNKVMTKEDKDLLLKDLCARLPYGVKIFHEITDETGNNHTYDGYVLCELSNTGQHITLLNYDYKHGVCEVDIECGEFKPYLRPMSSMTEEEKEKFLWLIDGDENDFENLIVYEICGLEVSIETFDWLNACHFDYRGLIERGLAIEVTKENNPYASN